MKCSVCFREDSTLPIGRVTLLYPIRTGESVSKIISVNICKPHMNKIAQYLNQSTNPYLKTLKTKTPLNFKQQRLEEI